MKFFNPDDSIVDVVSKITTILFTIFTFIFGWYAYHHTIHPIFEKEKELQRMTQERSFLSKSNADLKEQNALYIQQNKTSAYEASRLEQSAKEFSSEVNSKQQELTLANHKLEGMHKKLVLSELRIISGKLIQEYTISLAEKKHTEFDIIEKSYLLINNASNNNRINKYEKEAYSYFKDYTEINKNNALNTMNDKLHFALFLAETYQNTHSAFLK